MKDSGGKLVVRVGCLIAAATFAASACGSSAGSSASGTLNTSPTPSGAGSSPAAPALPAGCHGGVAHDIHSALEILTDPSDCPGSVNAFWTEQIGAQWTTPTFVAYSDGTLPQDACGTADGNASDFSDNAFFCPTDDTVAYSRELLDGLYQKGGPFLPVVVLMHELGHRADHILGVTGPISRSEENQADCSAGTETAFARTAHRLPFTDVLGAAKLLYQLGDTRHFGSELASSSDAHGTAAQRLIAYSRGYLQDNLKVCRTIGRSATGSVL
jgi:predicted metalloprotease